jgi:hypothetical protein
MPEPAPYSQQLEKAPTHPPKGKDSCIIRDHNFQTHSAVQLPQVRAFVSPSDYHIRMLSCDRVTSLSRPFWVTHDTNSNSARLTAIQRDSEAIARYRNRHSDDVAALVASESIPLQSGEAECAASGAKERAITARVVKAKLQ